MLDKNDLKAIQTVVDNSVKTQLTNELAPIKKDLTSIESKVDSVQQTLDDLVEVVAPINPWMDEIHKAIVKEELPKRVKRIEKRLGLPPLP